MRCGFCNLFTIANPKEGIQSYLNALEKEIDTYIEKVPNIKFTQYAIGGGTPTFLETPELNRLFEIMIRVGVPIETHYGSIEASPKTLTADKIKLIENYGITRLSLGIQSWIEEETKALGRPQSPKITSDVVGKLATSAIPEFNLDLIYGIKGQTIHSFNYSIDRSLEYQPTEIFLYPLYVRQLTGLNKINHQQEDHRTALYTAGRFRLLKAGYEQLSMRCFRKRNQQAPTITDQYDPVLDGMIGIGAGARSYTQNLHYSSDYAVHRKIVKHIIANYSSKTNFDTISYGFELNIWEQKTRFIIKSITDGGRFSIEKYKTLFRTNPFEEFELLRELLERQWLIYYHNHYRLSPIGMAYEDIIGPAFYSSNVRALMENFIWK